jgi:hypothetical protein
MPVSPPVSEDALLSGLITASWLFALASLVVWAGVFAVRVRRLRRARREALAEEELTGLVLDQISGYGGKTPQPVFADLPDWKRRVLLRIVCNLVEQTKGRDQVHLVTLLRTAGFRDQALSDLVHGTGLRRQQACVVLGFFDDESSTAGLRAALSDRDGAVRLAATRALLDKDRMGSLRELLDVLKFSPDDPPLIMSETLAHLPARLHPEAVAMLRTPLPPEWIRVLAINLARQQVLAAYDPITELRHSPSPRVRAAAWVALGELGDPRAADLLGEGLRDSVADVRRAAAGCAARLGGPEAVPLLEPLLREDDWWTGFNAAKALLALGAPGRAALAAFAAQAPDSAPAQAWREEQEGIRAG